MWVPLIENNEHTGDGADYFVKKHIQQLMAKSPDMDTILLGCTHYPLMLSKIRQYTPAGVEILAQGQIVAQSLKEYLDRHPWMEDSCTKGGNRRFFTTESDQFASDKVSLFYGEPAVVQHLSL